MAAVPAPAHLPEPAVLDKGGRLRSLDALRGFDMFWIIGGDAIAGQISQLAPYPAVQAVMTQFSEHVEWVGFRYYDMIFPLFLFIIGVSIPFAIGRRLEAGEDKGALLRKVLQRTAVLFLFGVIYNGALAFQGWDHVRIFGVLQRQALGYGAAAALFIYCKPRTQAIVGVALVFFYWALLLLIPVPGAPRGSMTEWGNAANYIDRLILLPGQMYEKYGDPEGLLSMIPSVSTALIGVFAGRWLRSDRKGAQKAAGLAIAGLVCLALGLAWAPLWPVIKKIWTGSYVLIAGGFSLELLALFYFIIDVRGWWRWSTFFAVIGMNAITIYMLSAIVDFGKVADFFVGGALEHIPTYKPLGMAIGVVAAEWLLLYFLNKNRIFLRV